MAHVASTGALTAQFVPTDTTSSQHSGCVKAHLVISGSQKPAQLNWNGSILLDPQGKFHTIYGTRGPALYFIRPNGYIGFRSQPANEEQLFGYLSKIFSFAQDDVKCSA